MRRVRLAVLAALVAGAMAPPPVLPDLPPPSVEPAPGDIVLRRGNGIWSRFFARLNRRDQRFSHVGVVVRHHGELKVAHAVADDDGTNGELRLDRLQDWRAAGRQFLLLRLDDRSAAARVADAARSMHASGPAFDFDFDLADSAAVYCSEFAWRALAAGLQRDPLPEKPVIGGRPVVLIENFLLDMPELQVVTPQQPATLSGRLHAN